MHRLTASKLALHMQCVGATFTEWEERPQHPTAERGHQIHEPLENQQLGLRREDILSRAHPSIAGELVAFLEKAPRIEPIPGWPTAEVTFAWHPETYAARVIGSGLKRDYDRFAPGEWGGTADVIGQSVAGMPTVLDWKTGQPRNQPRDPRDSWQMRFLGVCLWLVLGRPERVALELHLTKTGETRSAIAGEEQLATWLQAMRDLAARHFLVVTGQEEPVYMKGRECFYCNARWKCPLFNTHPWSAQ
jgi:hypothetical protein